MRSSRGSSKNSAMSHGQSCLPSRDPAHFASIDPAGATISLVERAASMRGRTSRRSGGRRLLIVVGLILAATPFVACVVMYFLS